MNDPDALLPENHQDQRESQSEPLHDVADVAPQRQAIQAIVAEGDDARWQLARTTARAVFQKPALVTPRRMALLGEEGLAAFVDEVRSLAKGFIKRERERQTRPTTAGPASADPAAERLGADTPLQQKKHRRPAPFGLLQPKSRSMAEVLKSRLQISKTAKAFILDALFSSVAAAIALALGLFAFRLAQTFS